MRTTIHKRYFQKLQFLLSRVITFTPQGFGIAVSAEQNQSSDNKCFLKVENTGVNLSKLGEIISSVSNGLSVEELPKGTKFIIEISVEGKSLDENTSPKAKLLPKQYPQYFSTIHKRLTQHFDHTEKIQAAAENQSPEYGVFMKKVNAVVNSNLNNFDFSVDDLANAMALSRAQLFRKLKQLTKMSPSTYIRFTRLQEAKTTPAR